LRVLIVDDSAEVRRLVAEGVASLGYEVVGEAAGGESAVTAAVALNPDVVVMDWHLPEMDGVAATEAICERRPGITVIGYSSAGRNDDVARRFIAAGASAYVDKADWAGLIAELRGHTGRSSADGPSAPAA
jgi:two-component system, response regulator PdtaR